MDVKMLIGICMVFILATVPFGSALQEGFVEDSLMINVTVDPAIDIMNKDAYERVVAPGDELIFFYSVQNKGDTNLKNLKVIDSIFGPIKMPFTKLIPMQMTTGTFRYVVPTYIDNMTVLSHNVTATAQVAQPTKGTYPKLKLEVTVQDTNNIASCRRP